MENSFEQIVEIEVIELTKEVYYNCCGHILS
jgi:hypothetical protein